MGRAGETGCPVPLPSLLHPQTEQVLSAQGWPLGLRAALLHTRICSGFFFFGFSSREAAFHYILTAVLHCFTSEWGFGVCTGDCLQLFKEN